MITYNLELNSHANKEGLSAVFIRVTENRKKKRINTGILLPKDHFNPKAKWGRWIRSSNPKHAVFNSQIENKIDELKTKADALSKLGLNILDKIEVAEVDPTSTTLKNHFESVINDMKIEKSVVYYRTVKSMLSRFQTFTGENMDIKDVTGDHVQKFKVHLVEQKLSGITINNILKRIHHVFSNALKTDKIERDPFRAHSLLPEIPKKKVRLTDLQIEKLEKLEISQDYENNWMYHTRNLYLFSYYNAGIRVGDLIQLRQSNITDKNRIEYEMGKTGHVKSIALNKSALRILSLYFDPKAKPNDYLFPILNSNAAYSKSSTFDEKKHMGFELRADLFNAVLSATSQLNNKLKVISKRLELPKPITFHTARHSFADKARRSMKGSDKITLYDIKNALGHSSITTTEKYMSKFDEESLDEAMEDIFEDKKIPTK